MTQRLGQSEVVQLVLPGLDLPEESSVALDEEAIIEVLRTVYDPEIPVNIFELGLIYGIMVDDDGGVDIQMTLTSPGCPVAGTLPGEVETKVAGVPGVSRANVELVWEPPWGPERMSEGARLELGFM